MCISAANRTTFKAIDATVIINLFFMGLGRSGLLINYLADAVIGAVVSGLVNAFGA